MGHPSAGMRDDPKWDIAFWVVAAVVAGLFVWVYFHATSGTEDFADPPPSLAPSAAIQSPSPSPAPDTHAPTPSPASRSLSPAPSMILPPILGREIAAEPLPPPPATGTPSTSSPTGISPSAR